MKRHRLLLSAFVVLVVSAASQAVAGDRISDWAPPDGLVPNEATAI
jgi:hypothetical protein